MALPKKLQLRLDEEKKFGVVIKALLANDPDTTDVPKCKLVVILDALNSGRFDEIVEASRESARKWDAFVGAYPRLRL